MSQPRPPCLVVKTGDGKQFVIEYNAGRCELIIDCVQVSVDILREMIVAPRSDRWFKFRREGDVVTVEERLEK